MAVPDKGWFGLLLPKPISNQFIVRVSLIAKTAFRLVLELLA